jgi:HEAT repeat protein
MLDVVQLLGPEAKPLVPAFIAILKDKTARDQWVALEALGNIGPAAAEAVPVLQAMLKEDPTRVRVGVALARLGRPDLAAPVAPILAERAELGPHDRTDFYRTLADLEALGRAAKPAVPTLLRLMRHNNSSFYTQAARALMVIDPEAAARAGVYDAPREIVFRQTGVSRDEDD